MLNLDDKTGKALRSDAVQIPSPIVLTRDVSASLVFETNQKRTTLEITGQIKSSAPGDLQDLIVYVECMDADGESIESPRVKLRRADSGKLYFYPLGIIPEGKDSFKKLITVDSKVQSVRVTLSEWRNRKHIIFELKKFAIRPSGVIDAPEITAFADVLDSLISGGLDRGGRVLDVAGAIPQLDTTTNPIIAAFNGPMDFACVPANVKHAWLDTRRMLPRFHTPADGLGQYTLISLYPHNFSGAALWDQVGRLSVNLDDSGFIITTVKGAELEAMAASSVTAKERTDEELVRALDTHLAKQFIPLQVTAIVDAADALPGLKWVVMRKAELGKVCPDLYVLVKNADHEAAADRLYDTLLASLLGKGRVEPWLGLAAFFSAAVKICDKSGRYDTAIKCLTCAAALDPEMRDWQLEAAARFRNREDFDTALAIINVFLQNFPNDMRGVISKALIYSQIGRGLEAMEITEGYLKKVGAAISPSISRTVMTLLRNFARECQSAGHSTQLKKPLLDPEIATTYLSDLETFAQKWYEPGFSRLYHHDAIDRRRERDKAQQALAPVPGDRKLRVLITSSSGWAFVVKMVKHLGLCEDDIEYRTFDFKSLEDQIRKDHLYEVFVPVSMGINTTAIWNRTLNQEKILGELVDWCDVVFCEWAGLHAAWLSRYLPPEKQLILRLHSYEAFSDWPYFINFGGVDGMVFVADHIKRLTDAQFHFSEHCKKTITLQNFNDPTLFSTTKTAEARRTLGMLGYSNLNKDPLFAAQLLLRLRQDDPAWHLRLTGSYWDPETLNPAELEYFRKFTDFIAENGLEEAITFVEFTNDIGAELTNVGFILSCSHREGTHEAIIEGMASGAVPVVRRWPMVKNLGAPETSYPDLSYFDTIEEAAGLVLAASAPDAFDLASRAAADYARERFNPEVAIRDFVGFLKEVDNRPEEVDSLEDAGQAEPENPS